MRNSCYYKAIMTTACYYLRKNQISATDGEGSRSRLKYKGNFECSKDQENWLMAAPTNSAGTTDQPEGMSREKIRAGFLSYSYTPDKFPNAVSMYSLWMK